METTTADSIILQKTRELCQTILDQPEFQTIRQQIDSFMANDEVKLQYQLLSERGEYLRHKQHQGLALSDEEIGDFETQREQFVNNPVARGFLDAQQEMHKVQESVGQYVNKTFELGRLPNPEDFDSGSCGHGCGCQH
ncbi:MAG: YlbF family regulator [Verrucomicrobia bacterium]|nr:YlbF family regulator [Verrucomicrobiota bacterium]